MPNNERTSILLNPFKAVRRRSGNKYGLYFNRVYIGYYRNNGELSFLDGVKSVVFTRNEIQTLANLCTLMHDHFSNTAEKEIVGTINAQQ